MIMKGAGMKQKGLVMLICLGILLPSFCSSQDLHHGTKTRVLEVRVSIDATNADVSDVLRELAVNYHIPCGMEFVSSNNASGSKQKVTIHAVDEKVKDVLDSVVGQDPRYRWDLLDGTINVMPSNRSESILDVEIPAVHLHNATVNEASRQIMGLKPVRDRLDKHHLGAGEFNPWKPNQGVNEVRISIDSRSSTLRQLLNQIAQQTQFWSAAEFGSEYWISFGSTGS